MGVKQAVRSFVKKFAKAAGVKPPKVIFLKKTPPHIKKYAELHGKTRDLERYGAMYYDPKDKAIKICPNTEITKFHLAHEFAHYLQDLRGELKETRMISKQRMRIEREADKIARRLLRKIR